MAPHRHQMKNLQRNQPEMDDDLDFEFTPIPDPAAPFNAPPTPSPSEEVPGAKPVDASSHVDVEHSPEKAEAGKSAEAPQPAVQNAKDPVVSEKPKKPRRKKVEEYTTTIRFPYDLFEDIETVKRKQRRTSGSSITISTIVCDAIYDRLEYSYKCSNDSCSTVFTMVAQGDKLPQPSSCPCCGATVKRYRMTSGR